MAKVKYVVVLRGVISTSTGMVLAKTHQADDVVWFTDDKQYFKVDHRIEGQPVLITPKGKYELTYNKAGFFEPSAGRINGVAVHVVLKKIVGSVIYWA